MSCYAMPARRGVALALLLFMVGRVEFLESFHLPRTYRLGNYVFFQQSSHMPRHHQQRATQTNIHNFNRMASEPKQTQQEKDSKGGSTGQQDLQAMKARLDKLEKTLLSKQLTASRSKGTMESLMGDIPQVSLELTAKTVEICSVIAFALLGSLIGFSLLDRLWLLGGIATAWWASGAVHRDTRGGALARWAGVLLAQSVREVQEKIYQFRIFYKTGRLAYVSSKLWEKYDNKYSIMKRLNLTKQQMMVSAASFRNTLEKEGYSNKFRDFYDTMSKLPDELVKYEEKYGLRNKVANGLGNFWEDTVDWVGRLGGSGKNNKFGIFGGFGSNRKNRLKRGRNVNPWAPVWTTLKSKKSSRNRFSY